MLRLAASVLVRSLVELGLVLLVVGAILFVCAWKITRRVATDRPDALERAAGPLANVLGLVAAVRRTPAGETGASDDEPELDWRRMVV